MGQHAIGLSFRNSGFFDRVDQSAVRTHSLLLIGAKESALQGYSTKFGMSVETTGVGLTYVVKRHLSRNLRNGQPIGLKKGRVSSVCTAAADKMDDQNLVPIKFRVSNGYPWH